MRDAKTSVETDRRKTASGGFTLIEVLLVVAILGILASVVAVNLSGRQEQAMIKATRASISAVATAVDLYEVDTGRFPSSLQSLTRDDGAPNWTGPYIRGGQVPKDGWGQDLKFEASGSSYKIVSDGPPGEGKPITSWDF